MAISSSRQWAFHILWLAGLFVAIHWWQSKPLAKGEAPPLTGELLSGDVFQLAALEGRPVLIHFWATWCPICKLQQSNIESLSQDYHVISVAMQSGGAETLHAYMQARDLTFPVLIDAYGELARAWGVRGVPSSFVIDREGTIKFVTVGLATEIGLRVRLALADNL